MKPTKISLTIEVIDHFFYYNYLDSTLRWKNLRSNAWNYYQQDKIDGIVLPVTAGKKPSIKIDNNYFPLFKIVWAVHFKEWPDIQIYPKNGIFSDTSIENLQLGKTESTIKTKTQIFISRASKIFNNLYDYSKTIFIHSLDKVIITCPVHGDFEQIASQHLRGGMCKECVAIEMRLGIDDFERRIYDKFQDRFLYDFANFRGLSRKITITCPDHGEFSIIPSRHLYSPTGGCPECSTAGTTSYEEFCDLANSKFGSKFIYPENNIDDLYVNLQSRIDIICPFHGRFNMVARPHLVSKHGCPQCSWVERGKLSKGGYMESYFEKHPDEKAFPAFLYYLDINHEKYFKIGITKDIYMRFAGIKSASKLPIKSLVIKPLPLYEAFLIEQFLLNYNSHIRIARKWTTELFSQNIIWQFDFFEDLIERGVSVLSLDLESVFNDWVKDRLKVVEEKAAIQFLELNSSEFPDSP